MNRDPYELGCVLTILWPYFGIWFKHFLVRLCALLNFRNNILWKEFPKSLVWFQSCFKLNIKLKKNALNYRNGFGHGSVDRWVHISSGMRRRITKIQIGRTSQCRSVDPYPELKQKSWHIQTPVRKEGSAWATPLLLVLVTAVQELVGQDQGNMGVFFFFSF